MFLETPKIFIIADDVSDIRNSLKNILKSIYKNKKTEISILECSDGIEILFRIFQLINIEQYNNISCIITDQFMNFMNGTEAISVINKLVDNKKISSIPIIFSTAFEDNMNISHINTVKPRKILNKPIGKQTLIETLKECCIEI